MTSLIELIRKIDLTKINESSFKNCYVGCLVLTKDNKILLQQQGTSQWHRFSGFLSTFGGRIEATETPSQALVRELKEELGADVIVAEAISLGAYTEAASNYSYLI